MFSLVGHWLATARVAHARHRAIESLSRLSDSQLLDIGLERGTIEEHVRADLPWEAWVREPPRALRPSVQGCG